MSVFAILALLGYSFSLALLIPSILRRNSSWPRLALFSAIVALVCHSVAIKQRIFSPDGGQNLSLLNIDSLVSFLICLIVTIITSRDRGWILLPIVYSFALINLALATFVPNDFITHLETTPGIMVHIGFALFAYTTLIIAALYALQLAWIDWLLKNKKLTLSSDILPLMTIERKMFYITQLGVFLLTLVLCTGFFYLSSFFSSENIDKAVFSILDWFVYMVLLWGHHYRGWRGLRVVWFNCGGALLLTLAYFGNRMFQYLLTS